MINIPGQPITNEASTAAHTLGVRYRNERTGKEYLYCLISGAITQYQAVSITPGFTAAALTKANADNGYKVGVAQIAYTTAYYGWIQVRGAGTLRVASACASEAALYTHATAGEMDDTATSQTLIKGIELTATAATAAASANATCYMKEDPAAFVGEIQVDANVAGIVTNSTAGSTNLLGTSSAMSSAMVAASSASSAASTADLASSAGSINVLSISTNLLAASSAMSSGSVGASNALLAYSAGSSAMSSASIGTSTALLAYSAGSSAMSSGSVAQAAVDVIELACSAYADSAVANSHSNAISVAYSADPNYIGLMLSHLGSGISSGIAKNF